MYFTVLSSYKRILDIDDNPNGYKLHSTKGMRKYPTKIATNSIDKLPNTEWIRTRTFCVKNNSMNRKINADTRIKIFLFPSVIPYNICKVSLNHKFGSTNNTLYIITAKMWTTKYTTRKKQKDICKFK